MPSWEEFVSDVPTRFALLPIELYTFQVNFVNFVPEAGTQLALLNQITAAAVNTLQANPHTDLGALSHRQETDELVALFFNHPVYDFQVILSHGSIRMGKRACSLEELFLTLPLLEDIGRQLFGKDTVTSLRKYSFMEWAHKSSHHFGLRLRVGPKLSDPKASTSNLDVVRWFANLDDTSDSVISVVQPDRVLRTDVDVSMAKAWFGRMRSLYLTCEAPYNVTQKDLNLEVSLSSGDAPGALGVIDDDLLNISWILPDFYREFVLKRLFPEIFKDLTVIPVP